VITLALDDNQVGVCISGSVISNLRFADDISLLADSDLDLQSLVDKVNKTSGRFGLQISTSKTELQVIGSDTTQSVIHVKLDNNELKQTEDFVYLGGTVSSDTSCDKDIARRVGLAAGVARSLEKI